MSYISRRSFLEIASGALGSSAFGGLVYPVHSLPTFQLGERTKLYVVFFSTAPSRDDTSVVPETHDEIIRKLESVCDGVDFVVRDLTKGVRLENVLNESKSLKASNYDGVIVYGWPRDYDLLRTGLPTINVSIVNDFMNNPFPLYKENRVISAFLDPWKFTADAEVSERMFQDLADKIRMIQMLRRMKHERILTVTDSEYVNVTYGDLFKHMPADYNAIILDAISEVFGTRVTKIGSKEVTGDREIQELWSNESQEAIEISQRWIRDAEKMMNTIESEVIRSAKVYLAMRLLMRKYDATAMAFHIRTLTPNPTPEDYVVPALATSEFQLDNVVAKCQSHLNIILSEMLLQYTFRRPSMLGDYSVDTYSNTSIVQHCEGPWNPWGDERRVPYNLVDHRERQVRARSTTGVGAASWILYPGDEAVTIWQIDVQRKEILLHVGPSVPMLSGAKRYKDHLYEMM